MSVGTRPNTAEVFASHDTYAEVQLRRELTLGHSVDEALAIWLLVVDTQINRSLDPAVQERALRAAFERAAERLRAEAEQAAP